LYFVGQKGRFEVVRGDSAPDLLDYVDGLAETLDRLASAVTGLVYAAQKVMRLV